MSRIYFCKDFGVLLSNPQIKSKSMIGFEETPLAEHVKNCKACKKGIKLFYESKANDIPFTIKIFTDKLISKITGE